MVNTVLPENLGTIFGSFYIHNALQPKKAVTGVEELECEYYVAISMCWWRQLSEVVSEDGRWKWSAHITIRTLLAAMGSKSPLLKSLSLYVVRELDHTSNGTYLGGSYKRKHDATRRTNLLE